MTIDEITNTIPEEVTIFDARVRDLPTGLSLGSLVGEWLRLNTLLVYLPYLNGELPYHCDLDVGVVDGERPLVPAGGTLVRVCRAVHAESHLVVGPGWVATLNRQNDGALWVSMSAESEATAAPVAAEVASWVLPLPQEPARVDVTFMYAGSYGAVQNRRRFDVREWSDIRRNYVPAVQAKVDRLVAYTPETLPPGRLLLVHGPPGTGKTTLLRALALAWRQWCGAVVVVDPEALFTNPAYLFDAILGDDEEGEARPGWRLFIIEDCDELIRSDAKVQTGQALSRLLNLADGLVGQGTRVLVCLTTNERIEQLHPAVRRTGRCLMEIEVPRFDRAGTRAWLGGAAPVASDGASLAEMYALLAGGEDAAAPEAPVGIGQYL